MILVYAASVLSGVLSIACYVPYVRDVMRGATKPERSSWLIWSVLGTMGLLGQYALGARASLSLAATQSVGILVIFFLSLRRGTGLLGVGDMLTLFVAFHGLLLWHFMRRPLFALLAVIAIDVVALVPTLIKAYRYPETETVITWVLAGLAASASLASLWGRASLVIALYPLYTVVLNAAVLAAIYLGRHK